MSKRISLKLTDKNDWLVDKIAEEKERQNRCEVVFTKDMFIKAIHEIEKQYNHDRKCSDAFKVLLPNDYTSNYDNHWLQNQLIEILQIAMNDNHKDSWIEYYLWELDFGRKWKKDSVKVKGKNFKLQNAYDLWDLLNLA